ncbi:MAG: hypothetical protein OHK0029_26330 [Armatimonadaceae bacterium]
MKVSLVPRSKRGWSILVATNLILLSLLVYKAIHAYLTKKTNFANNISSTKKDYINKHILQDADFDRMTEIAWQLRTWKRVSDQDLRWLFEILSPTHPVYSRAPFDSATGGRVLHLMTVFSPEIGLLPRRQQELIVTKLQYLSKEQQFSRLDEWYIKVLITKTASYLTIPEANRMLQSFANDDNSEIRRIVQENNHRK